MKVFRVIGLAIGGVLLAGSALAQGPGAGLGFAERRPPMERALGIQGIQGRWWNNPKIIEQLKLTDEQRKTFDGILLEHREKLIDLRANVEKAELAMEPLIGVDQPNEAAILTQIDKVAQARAELEKANARFLLAIRNKLTPEQWKQIQAFRANRGEEHGKDAHLVGPGGWKQNRHGRGGQYQYGRPVPPPPPDGAEPDAPAAPPVPPAPGAGAEQ